MNHATAKAQIPFDDITSLIKKMPSLNQSHASEHDVRSRELMQGFSKNSSDLGLFHILSRYITLAQNRYPPMVVKPEIAIFFSAQNVENIHNSAAKQIADDLIEKLKTGNHIVNQICNTTGCGLKTYDLNSDIPTEDITTESAMSEVEATQVIAYSMEAVRDSDLLIISDLGGHTHISAQALTKVLFKDHPDIDTLSINPLSQKALDYHKVADAPLELLRRLGSREIAAMVGTIIAGSYQNVPIILDGLTALVAAAIVYKIKPDGIQHCILGQHYNHDFAMFIAKQIGLVPYINLGIALDSGIGSAMLVNIIKTAISVHTYTNT